MPLEFRTPAVDDPPATPGGVSTLPRPGAAGNGVGHHDLTTAHDGELCVGSLTSSRIDLTVPGDVRLTAAAITGFSVEPSHRRRGVLTGLMSSALTEAHTRGQVLATLSSPMAGLHPRFGFGLASDACVIEVDPRSATPIHRPARGTIQVMSTDEAADVLPEVYERCARARTGTISRSPADWQQLLAEPPDAFAPVQSSVAFHLDSTERADGYVKYEVTIDADGASAGVVRDLWAENSEIERALWTHLVTIEHVTVWRAPRRPADDPVRFAMADVRAYRVAHRFDEQWLRILDVDIALATRTYTPSTRSLTVRVLDPILSHNTGTWRVDAYGSFRSQGEADFEIGIETLSAAYLGGTSFQELRDSGRIIERRPDAAADADTLFAARPQPFCGT